MLRERSGEDLYTSPDPADQAMHVFLKPAPPSLLNEVGTYLVKQGREVASSYK